VPENKVARDGIEPPTPAFSGLRSTVPAPERTSALQTHHTGRPQSRADFWSEGHTSRTQILVVQRARLEKYNAGELQTLIGESVAMRYCQTRYELRVWKYQPTGTPAHTGRDRLRILCEIPRHEQTQRGDLVWPAWVAWRHGSCILLNPCFSGELHLSSFRRKAERFIWIVLELLRTRVSRC
jgi:hypothetical protein